MLGFEVFDNIVNFGCGGKQPPSLARAALCGVITAP
jgi:hypothetical protein